jgi:hypothetical protein
MKISAKSQVPFPLPLVYATFRDRLVDLVPYMPNIRAVEVKSRREENGKIACVNDWHGGGDIPSAARMILSEDMLSWTESITWNEANFTADWRIQTHAFTEAVKCFGRNRFWEENGITFIENHGELIIDPHQIQGFPAFMTGGIAHLVEEVLGSKISPNLNYLSQGVRRYLEQQSV